MVLPPKYLLSQYHNNVNILINYIFFSSNIKTYPNQLNICNFQYYGKYCHLLNFKDLILPLLHCTILTPVISGFHCWMTYSFAIISSYWEVLLDTQVSLRLFDMCYASFPNLFIYSSRASLRNTYPSICGTESLLYKLLCKVMTFTCIFSLYRLIVVSDYFFFGLIVN